MRRQHIRGLAVIVLIPATACSLFLSMDDLRGGASDGGAPDVPTDVPVDEKPIPETGTDGGRFCESVHEPTTPTLHVLCRDFDDPHAENPFDGWQLHIQPPSNPFRVEEIATSVPRALLAEVPTGSAGRPTAHMYREFPEFQPDKLTLSFDFMMESTAGGDRVAEIAVVTLDAASAAKFHALNFLIGTNSAYIQEDYPGVDGGRREAPHPFVGALPSVSKTWWHARIEIDRLQRRLTASLSDGRSQAIIENEPLAAPGWPAAPSSIQIGISFAEVRDGPPWRFRYDNIVYRMTR